MGYYTRYSITAYNYKDGRKEKIVEIDDSLLSFEEEEQMLADDIESIVGYLPTGSLLSRNEEYPCGLVIVDEKGKPTPWKDN